MNDASKTAALAFLHTADIHIASFDALLDAAGHSAPRRHVVRDDLLDRARASDVAAVADDTLAVLSKLADHADAVMCSCSTLGPLADIAPTPVIRIDRPMMECAAHIGGRILVAICLHSTVEATRALLIHCAAEAKATVTADIAICDTAWHLFEHGDTMSFAQSIAAQINAHIANHGAPDCVVLGQASMAVAAPLLADLPVPILTSPQAAVEALLAAAAR